VIPTNVKERAEATFKIPPRTGESARILAKIQAERFVTDEKIERLKSLRLTAETSASVRPKIAA
jgi:hypothetical protein